MNEKTKELIAIGASVAGHCQPCLTYHLEEAKKLGITQDEIKEAIAVGKMIEKGAMSAMGKFADSLLNNGEKTESPKPKKLSVYDPAMCCSTGVCGTNVDTALVEFAGTLKILAQKGIALERYNLSQQPAAFAENQQVKKYLTDLGSKALPFIFIDDNFVMSGRYPTAKELFDLFKIEGAVLIEKPSLIKNLRMKLSPKQAKEESSCCGGDKKDGGCC